MKRVLAAAVFALAIPVSSRAQATDTELQLLRLLSLPVNALPAIGAPMPASRNHSYIIGRLQSGYRKGPSGFAMPAVAGGIDLQYKGGSILGLTAGYQKRDCGVLGDNCGGHAMFGFSSDINLMTGGSMFAALLHDNSTTSTLGLSMGFDYAPKYAEDKNGCAIDVGVPLTVAKRRQRPRLVGYVTPGIVWDFNCGSSGPSGGKTYRTDFGLALQQVGNRSLDIYLGMQKLFRGRTGFLTGLSFSYVRLP